MSRYQESYDYDFDYPNAGDLWQANIRRALRGKRGRQALLELREALLALPEKRLVARALCTVGGEERVMKEVPATTVRSWAEADRQSLRDIFAEQGAGVCAVGAYVWWKKVKAGMSPEAAFEALPTLDDENHGLDETAFAGTQMGLAGVLAWEFAYRNDESFADLTPEERYTAYLKWIDKELAA